MALWAWPVHVVVTLLLLPFGIVYMLFSVIYASIIAISTCCCAPDFTRTQAHLLPAIPILRSFSVALHDCLRLVTGSGCVLRYLACTGCHSRGKPVAATILALMQRFGSSDAATQSAQAAVSIVGDDTQSTLVKLLDGIPVVEPRELRVMLVNEDSVTAALEQALEYPGSVAIHDAANRVSPGGSGMLPYGGSQEEALIRASNLYWVLNPLINTELSKQLLQQQPTGISHHIPYFGAVYCPGVTFLTDSNDPNNVAVFDVIATAGIDLRPKSDEWQLYFKQASADDIRHVTQMKVEALLAAAATRGVRAIVLAAQGCGVFARNPLLVAKDIDIPYIVADCFAHALKSRFRCSFDRAVFAIYSPPGHNNSLLGTFRDAMQRARLPILETTDAQTHL